MKRALLIAVILMSAIIPVQASTGLTAQGGEYGYYVAISYRQNIANSGETPVYQTADAPALNCPESDQATATACAFTVLQHGAIIIDDRTTVIVSPEVIERATAYTAERR